jgi:ABC-type arginine transport system ATPase subunit
MTAENFEQVLHALTERQPFHVFTVELNGGKRFEVDHARALVVRDGVAVFIAPGGVPVWFDHESVNQIVGASANSEV